MSTAQSTRVLGQRNVCTRGVAHLPHIALGEHDSALDRAMSLCVTRFTHVRHRALLNTAQLPKEATAMSAAEDLNTCLEILPRVSRTFALSIEALPVELREAVRIAYLLCRVVDTIEDADGLAQSQREQMFTLFDDLLGGVEDEPEHLAACARHFDGKARSQDIELIDRCGAVFRRFWALDAGQRSDIRGPVLRMSTGMRAYTRRWAAAGRLQIETDDDLEQYCYYVAGTVGELLTALFLRHQPLDDEATARLQRRCGAFGTGLQLVNILKDVAEDATRAVCYVPETRLASLGPASLGPARLLDPARRDQALASLSPLLALARTRLDEALQYCLAWPETAPGVRMFLAVPLALALRSLALIEAGGQAVLSSDRTPKVSRNFVMECMSRAPEAAGSNAALLELLRYASEGLPPELDVVDGADADKAEDERSAASPPQIMDLAAYLLARKQRVEDALSQSCNAKGDDAGLSAATRYSLLAGGKRLRPILFMAAAEAMGEDPDAVLPAACALEMIHSYSLVHDDLPAMDDAPLRRGKPTSHVEYGEATAILAGDALLTDAFDLVASGLDDRFSASAKLNTVCALARAAGSEGMVLGQMLDMEGETRDLHLGELVRLHHHKTGALLRFAVEGAAILCDAPVAQRQALRQFGERIGLAFQIADDVLDVISDSETMGKPCGADEANQKTTFPGLMGLEASRERARALVEQAKVDLELFGPRAQALRAIADYVVERVQ